MSWRSGFIKGYGQAFALAYAAFSVVSTLYLVVQLKHADTERTALINMILTQEERLLQVERLWGVASCQGATKYCNP